MKTYFFTVKHKHWRNGTTVAMTAGIVKAAGEEDAEEIIFKNASATNTFALHLTEIQEKETLFADYILAAVFR